MIYINLLVIPLNMFIATKTRGTVMWLNLFAAFVNLLVVASHIS